MTEILALIPARMGSSRFPGKPLAKLLGEPKYDWRRWRRLAALPTYNTSPWASFSKYTPGWEGVALSCWDIVVLTIPLNSSIAEQ